MDIVGHHRVCEAPGAGWLEYAGIMTMISPETGAAMQEALFPLHPVQKTGVLTLEADHFPERRSSQIAGREDSSSCACALIQESQCCPTGRHVGAAHEGGVPRDAGVIAAGKSCSCSPTRPCLRMRAHSLPTASDTISFCEPTLRREPLRRLLSSTAPCYLSQGR